MSISWLISPTGREVIESAREYLEPLRAVPALRKKYPEIASELISQAMSQAGLQLRLEERWGVPTNQFLLTQDGISQATRPVIAKYRAQEIVKRFGKNAHVLDLTCGLGFDSREFALAGLKVTALEIDPTVAEYAQHNLSEFGIVVICADATKFQIPADIDVVFVDPARRDPQASKSALGQAKRIFNPQLWSPSWDSIIDISSRFPVMAKVAPGMDKSEIGNWDAKWLSSAGDLLECFISFPGTGVRSAVLISAESGNCIEVPGESQTRTQNLGRFLVIPDPALIRASALTPLADSIKGGLVNEHIAWLTTDDETGVRNMLKQDPVQANALLIESVFKFSDKELITQTRKIPAAGVTIMTRGMQLDVEMIRKSVVKVTAPGNQELIVAIYRDDAGPQALLCRRISSLN
ncbi:MAG: class I SAM-dependent methyltransferase [Candidatus Nanopelagicales bacterium]|nr:class I SAM-dependent methyltransferase [Candidatus Nanopelagicales bacterium]